MCHWGGADSVSAPRNVAACLEQRARRLNFKDALELRRLVAG
jgi:hypothetical protein